MVNPLPSVKPALSTVFHGVENTVLGNVTDKIVDSQNWEGIELCGSVNRL